jgi:archaemetzincin
MCTARQIIWMAVAAIASSIFMAGAIQFTPPDSLHRLAAIGPEKGLREELRRAVDPREDFQPVPRPGPADWLSNHPEPGQTFEQFVLSRPNQPDSRRNKLYLAPIGSFAQPGAPRLDELVWFAGAFFTIGIATLPPIDIAQEHIENRRNPSTGQTQLLTTDLLDLLRKRLPSDAFALLGITMTDLYPDPKWNFVFGEASLRDRVGVYSFARYNPAFYGEERAGDVHKLMFRRSCKVLAHEASHIFGIEHCIWYRCLMNGSNHIQEADARPLHLCPVDLRKLQWSIGFDVVGRYRRLLEFDQAAGFSDEAGWLQKRLQFIQTGHS